MNSKYIGIGKKKWVFAAGRIPLHSTGREPEFTSHDKIAVLNTSSQDAEIKLTIYYEDQQPVTDHAIKIPARRVRKIKFNDLIDPLPIPLDKAFGFTLTCNVEVVIQFSRMDTSKKHKAIFCVTPHAERET
jgi:hypothetical protein